jgi:hypothetical protein
MTFHDILVPIELSSTSIRALEIAVSLASPVGARTTLFPVSYG